MPLQLVDEVVIERRDVAIFFRRQALQPSHAGMDEQRVDSRRGDLLGEREQSRMRILVVDPEPAFDA